MQSRTSRASFTNASPGAASSGISLAPNSFTGQNRRLPDPNPRQTHQRTCVGITDIEGAALVAYSDGIFMFANQRGANTGEDFDCRLFVINLTRGCISYLGLTAGNGWAAYPTTEGIIVTDKNRREFSISGDIFNPSDNTGDLPYEVGQSAVSVAGDTDNQYLSCAVVGSKLAVAYRLSSFDPRISYYDFSPGVEASGVEQLLNPDTKSAYVWSPPAVYNASMTTTAGIGAIGSVRGSSTGLSTYVSWDTNIGATGDGRIDKINTGTADNTQTLASYAVVPPLIANPFMALQVQSVEATHRTFQSTGSSILAFATDQVPTFVTAVPGLGRTLTTDTTRQYQKQVVPVDQGQRAKTDAFWAVWQSNAVPSGATADRIWRMVFRYTEVEN
jgi:hypothetical protein